MNKWSKQHCLFHLFLVYLQCVKKIIIHKTMRNKYTMIACINNNGAIAKNGNLMYNIKADMANFKSLTIDNVVIMGRKTFESLPNSKPLKNRINIIVTGNSEYSPVNADTWTKEELNNTYLVNSLQEADDLCFAYFADKELFIIGGGQIYSKAYELDMVDKAIITLVNDDAEGDVYFPDFENDDKFKVIFKTMSLRDHPNDTYYRYIVYKRK